MNRKSIRPRSKKRAAQERDYKFHRDKYLEDHPICEAGTDGCTYYAWQIHHKKGRIGNLLTDTTFFMAVCGICHEWIERNPEHAKQKGWSISRLAK